MVPSIRYVTITATIVGLSACSAGVEDNADQVVSVSQAVISPPMRYIPIRAFALVDDDCAQSRECGSGDQNQTCAGSAGMSDSQYESNLTDTINYINTRYEDAHLWFYLRDFTRIQANYTWCNNGSPTWAQVKTEIRSAFPEIPPNGWSNNATMTATQWLSTAAALSFDDAINLYIGNGSVNMCSGGDSCGQFPCTGKFIYLTNSSLAQMGNVLPHELGHYLSLSHTWDNHACKSPTTKANYPKSADWGFVFSGNHFFQSQAEAAQYESTLQRINNAQTGGNCGKSKYTVVGPDGKEADHGWYSECTLNGQTYNSGGPVSGDSMSTGDPEIAALARYSPSQDVYQLNLMSYGGNYLAASQYNYIEDTLSYETPNSGFAHIGTLPSWVLDLYGRRPQLGLAREMLDESLNFCLGNNDRMYVGDFDSDGKADLLCNGADRTLRIHFMNSLTADVVVPNRTWCVSGNERLYVGNFDGVLGDDLLCLNTSGDQFLDLNDGHGNFTGSNFINGGRKLCPFDQGTLYIGQFDGVGGDDALCNWFNGTMSLDYSNSQGVLNSNDWVKANRNFCLESGSKLYVGDVNNDGRGDIICNRTDGDLIIDLHYNGFTGSNWWLGGRNFCNQASAKLLVGDYNGDGIDDIACIGGASGVEVDTGRLNTYFSSTTWFGKLDGFCQSPGDRPVSGDFDGDGKVDLLCNQASGLITTVYSGLEW